jgi:hypothetical protein
LTVPLLEWLILVLARELQTRNLFPTKFYTINIIMCNTYLEKRKLNYKPSITTTFISIYLFNILRLCIRSSSGDFKIIRIYNLNTA